MHILAAFLTYSPSPPLPVFKLLNANANCGPCEPVRGGLLTRGHTCAHHEASVWPPPVIARDMEEGGGGWGKRRVAGPCQRTVIYLGLVREKWSLGEGVVGLETGC